MHRQNLRFTSALSTLIPASRAGSVSTCDNPTVHMLLQKDKLVRTFSSVEKPKIVIQKRGDFPYGSREYLLAMKYPYETDDESDSSSKIASLRAHRNIIFGARLFGQTAEKRKISEVCLPLLDAALADASIEGEQPQAMATLHGLCDWVAECIRHEENSGSNPPKSEALQKMKESSDLVSFHAVQAIATGIPREGHSIVGQGTFRDGEQGWEALAQEFTKLKLADEVELYHARGGTVAVIEHLADTKPEYLRSAGGAMARLFFV